MDVVMKSLSHPDEIIAYVRYKLYQTSKRNNNNESKLRHSLSQCYNYLNQTSRSFAAVIQELDGDLRHAVCIFYLVLRALDTIEDDMTIPLDKKTHLLTNFHTFLFQPNWRYTESGEKDRVVLEDFTSISKEFRWLSPVYQSVICDICKRMACGMTLYLTKKIITYIDWDEYSHYVAGLVGIGLSKLFSASELEDSSIGEDERLANSMGLFLQKTNIIRDFLEDHTDGRLFWPQEAWSKYTHRSSPSEFVDGDNEAEAVKCLNELVTNSLVHIPDVVTYMNKLKNQSIFNFCAIPQVMAISTLELCYANPAVFKTVVKLRRGETLKFMMRSKNTQSVKSIFADKCHKIISKISESDPHATLAKKRLHTALTHCTPIIKTLSNFYVSMLICFLFILTYTIFVT